MTIQKFTTESLAIIDGGRIAAALESAIRRCELDCKDRPAVEDERTVTLKITLVPVIGEDGQMDTANLRFQVSDRLPTRKSKIYNMRAEPGGLLYNELSLDEVRQGTIDELGPKSTSPAPASTTEGDSADVG